MGRGFIRRAEEGLAAWAKGDSTAIRQVAEALHSYAELLRAHIGKENHVLFSTADKVLIEAEQEHLAARFEKVEEEETGQGVHQKYHSLAHELVGGKI